MTVQSLVQGFQSYREWATDPIPRIGFGMDWFDGPTGGGIARSEWCLFQAFSSVGKTTFALNVIRNNPHIPVLFMSMEMHWRMVAARLAAMDIPTSTQYLEQQARNGIDMPELQAVVDKYRSLVCDDTPAISLKRASDSFHEATEVLGTPPRLVVWDYLELIGGGGLSTASEKIDKAARAMRDWTREHDTASLVLHQIGKGTGGHQPMSLAEGRYGGYQPADYVIGAYAPRLNPELDYDGYQAVKDDIWFQLLKNRNGSESPTGKRYRKDPLTMRIHPWGQIPTLPKTSPAPQQSTVPFPHPLYQED